MSAARSDLLALDEKALVVLANRGLLKRATKELAASPPQLEVLEDGTVIGRFPDAEARLPPGVALGKAPCSCGASKACRHRVGTVLAYQQSVLAEGPPPSADPAPVVADPRPDEVPGPPGAAAWVSPPPSDEALLARVGKRNFDRARSTRRAGLVATVAWGSVVQVRLPASTVSFLVPWDLAHARCDCRASADCEHVALAVWAARAASGVEPEEVVSFAATRAREGDDPRGELEALIEELVSQGWSRAAEGVAPRLTALSARFRRARQVWCADAVDALGDRLGELSSGAGAADPNAVTSLLWELALRARAEASDRHPEAWLRGDADSGAEPLDRVVIRALGARYRAEAGGGRLSIFYREGESTDTWVLERHFASEGWALPGPAAGKKRISGRVAHTLATSALTSRGVKRRPNGALELSSRKDFSSVMPATFRVDAPNYAALAELISRRRLPEASPRLLAPRVVSLAFGAVVERGYDPGRRTVWGQLEDPSGARVWVISEWRPEAPGAPACLARALLEGADQLAGEAWSAGGRIWVTPTLIARGSEVQAPDLVPELPLPELPKARLPDHDSSLARVLTETRGWLSDLARRGLRHAPRSVWITGEGLTRQARQAGADELATRLAALEAPSAEAWTRAGLWLRLVEHASA